MILEYALKLARRLFSQPNSEKYYSLYKIFKNYYCKIIIVTVGMFVAFRCLGILPKLWYSFIDNCPGYQEPWNGSQMWFYKG